MLGRRSSARLITSCTSWSPEGPPPAALTGITVGTVIGASGFSPSSGAIASGASVCAAQYPPPIASTAMIALDVKRRKIFFLCRF